MNSPDVLFDEENQKEGAKLVKKVNTKVAKLIGINPAARTTCVKPSGNASVLLKTASGIHAEHSPRYLRHVQMNKESEVAQLIAQTNPYMVEESVWSSNQTDYSIGFPVIAKEGSIYRRESLGIDFLDKVKKVQANWVEYGTNTKYCADPTVRHNVSNTCTVPNDQWDAVEEYVFQNRKYFSGISFLSDSGDKAYNQAPNAEVLTEEQIVKKYGRAALFASGLIVDSHKGFANLWEAISVAKYKPDQTGELSDLRAEWIRRFDKFTKNYFGGNFEMSEHCLKDVHYLHKWTKIQQNLNPIDFTNQLQTKKFTDIDTTGAAACVGGGCEISF
jgi:ribonucleoside-diphosphate reductase alpha chain